MIRKNTFLTPFTLPGKGYGSRSLIGINTDGTALKCTLSEHDYYGMKTEKLSEIACWPKEKYDIYAFNIGTHALLFFCKTENEYSKFFEGEKGVNYNPEHVLFATQHQLTGEESAKIITRPITAAVFDEDRGIPSGRPIIIHSNENGGLKYSEIDLIANEVTLPIASEGLDFSDHKFYLSATEFKIWKAKTICFAFRDSGGYHYGKHMLGKLDVMVDDDGSEKSFDDFVESMRKRYDNVI